MDGTATMNSLPIELIGDILMQLDVKERLKASLVCKVWQTAVWLNPSHRKSVCISIDLDDLIDIDVDIVSSLGRKRIPNLRLLSYFAHKNDEQMETNCPTLGRYLGTEIRYMELRGEWEWRYQQIRQCFQSFTEIEQLVVAEPSIEFKADGWKGTEMNPTHGGSLMFLKHLSHVTIKVPSECRNSQFVDFMCCLDGVENINLCRGEIDLAVHPFATGGNEHLDDSVFKIFTRPNLASRLRELDLRNFQSLSPTFIGTLLNVPDLRPHTLKTECGLGDTDLLSLADSDWPLRVLEVTSDFGSDISFQGLSELLLKKGSLQNCSFSNLNLHSTALKDFFCEWQNIDEVILRRDCSFRNLVKMEFSLRTEGGSRVNELKVDTTLDFDYGAIGSLAQFSPGLRKLYLERQWVHLEPGEYEEGLSEDAMFLLGTAFSELGILRLRQIANAMGLSSLSVSSDDGSRSKLLKLKSLCLSGCLEDISDGLIRMHLPNLKHLWLSEAEWDDDYVTDEMVRSITSCNPTLELLALGNCNRVTDEGVGFLVHHLKYLKCLYLHGCRRLTLRSAKMITEKCHFLEYIDVTYCNADLVSWMTESRHNLPFLCTVVAEGSPQVNCYQYHGRYWSSMLDLGNLVNESRKEEDEESPQYDNCVVA